MATNIGRIDLYLAGTMRPSKDLADRLAAAATDLCSARGAVQEASRTVFADPLRVKPSQLIQFFGAPSREDPFAISYDLQLWPQHRYYWHVDDHGLASHGGFVLREPIDLLAWVPRELEAVQRLLRPRVPHDCRCPASFWRTRSRSEWVPATGLVLRAASGWKRPLLPFRPRLTLLHRSRTLSCDQVSS